MMEELIPDVDPTEMPPVHSEPVVPKTESEPFVAPSPVTPTATVSTNKLETDAKLFAALSYLSILFVVPWVVKRDDKFVAFHIRQGMGLFFAEVVIWIALWLLESVLTTIFSYRVTGFIVLLNQIVWLLIVTMSILGVYYATQGKTKPLPYMEPITKNIKL